MKRACILLAIVLMAGATVAQADPVILSPVAATSSVGHFTGCCEIERTIDQSGLLTPFTSGVTDFDAYIAGTPLHDIYFDTEWFAPLEVLSGTIIYDLGAIYSTSAIAFWNEDAAGTASFALTASGDAAFTTPIFLGTFFPTNHTINVDYFADVYGGRPFDVRYFKLDVTGVPGADFVSIGEVAFRVDPVPEPGTMILLGTGLVGLARFARRKNS